jgi:hypothetical protein
MNLVLKHEANEEAVGFYLERDEVLGIKLVISTLSTMYEVIDLTDDDLQKLSYFFAHFSS